MSDLTPAQAKGFPGSWLYLESQRAMQVPKLSLKCTSLTQPEHRGPQLLPRVSASTPNATTGMSIMEWQLSAPWKLLVHGPWSSTSSQVSRMDEEMRTEGCECWGGWWSMQHPCSVHPWPLSVGRVLLPLQEDLRSPPHHERTPSPQLLQHTRRPEPKCRCPLPRDHPEEEPVSQGSAFTVSGKGLICIFS